MENNVIHFTTTRPRVGDKVSVDDPKYPGIWIVTKLNPARAVLEPFPGGGRALRAPYSMLLPPSAAPIPAGPTVFYHLGELIRITDGSKYATDLWVVIADKGGDRVNLAKLGGDNDRYLRYPRRALAKIDPAEVLK